MPRLTHVSALAVLLLAGAAVAAPARAESVGSTLEPGQTIRPGQELTSPSGQHAASVGQIEEILALTVDGQPCGWDLIGASDETPTDGRLVMQTDGNLVFYNGNTAAWNSRTAGNPGARAVMQDDRNLVVYSRTGRPLYATGRTCSEGINAGAEGIGVEDITMRPGHYMLSPDRRTRLVMQTDGNLVLYAGTRALWNSRTQGNPGAVFHQQVDGNLVVYSTGGKALWNSGSRWPVDYPTRLRLQNDGNLTLAGSDSAWRFRTIWQTGTRR